MGLLEKEILKITHSYLHKLTLSQQLLNYSTPFAEHQPLASQQECVSEQNLPRALCNYCLRDRATPKQHRDHQEDCVISSYLLTRTKSVCSS